MIRHEDIEQTIRNVGRRAYLYGWDNETYRARRAQLAHTHDMSIEEVQLLCGEGWREALNEEQEEGLPLLYIRELRDRLDAWGEEELVWLCETVINELETTNTTSHPGTWGGRDDRG